MGFDVNSGKNSATCDLKKQSAVEKPVSTNNAVGAGAVGSILSVSRATPATGAGGSLYSLLKKQQQPVVIPVDTVADSDSSFGSDDDDDSTSQAVNDADKAGVSSLAAPAERPVAADVGSVSNVTNAVSQR